MYPIAATATAAARFQQLQQHFILAVIKMTNSGTLQGPLRLSDVDFDSPHESYPGLVLTGDAVARGRTYGRAFVDKIRANVTRHLTAPGIPVWGVCLDLIENVYIPGLRQHWDHGWREMVGLSQGSGVSLVHIVLLNVRDDLAAFASADFHDKVESTTAFFSPRKTSDKAPILAHSWTAPENVADSDLLVYLEIHFPDEERPNIFMVTEAGMVSGCGMNSDGLAVARNRIFSTQDGAPEAMLPCFPVTCLERFLLEWNQPDSAQRLCEALRRHASRHILLSCREGSSTSLEISPESVFVYQGPTSSTVKVHTNHFQSFAAFAARRKVRDRYRGTRSQARLCHFSNLVDQHGTGRLSPEQIKTVFSDHGGGDGRICPHANAHRDDETVAFVMFDTKQTVVSVCKGPPCSGTMMHFKVTKKDRVVPHIKGGVPAVGPRIPSSETKPGSKTPLASEPSDSDLSDDSDGATGLPRAHMRAPAPSPSSELGTSMQAVAAGSSVRLVTSSPPLLIITADADDVSEPPALEDAMPPTPDKTNSSVSIHAPVSCPMNVEKMELYDASPITQPASPDWGAAKANGSAYLGPGQEGADTEAAMEERSAAESMADAEAQRGRTREKRRLEDPIKDSGSKQAKRMRH